MTLLDPEHLHDEIVGSGDDEQLPKGISDEERLVLDWVKRSLKENTYLAFAEGGKLQLVHVLCQGKPCRIVSSHLSKKSTSNHIVTT